MNAYFDNSATTRVLPQVQELMVRIMDQDYGNPSSLHRKGMEAEAYVKMAAKQIAASLKADPKEIIFTSGGTESNNMALFGAAMACRRQGNHIITTAIEHASIGAPMRFLEEQGFRVTYLPVDHKGVVSLDALKEAIDPETILVSVMYVNNEIGTIQPVDEIARIVHEANPKTLFHVDAIQAFGKLTIRPKRQGIDLLSVSSHKFHGPKGVGFLYCSDRVRIQPLILGGGQQKGMRSGTENVPGIAGMGLAAELIYLPHEENTRHLNALRRRMLTGLHEIEGVTINGWDETADGEDAVEKRSPHIISVSVDGVRSEVLLHALEEREVYVSAGSACSSNKPSVSSTLKAIGVPKEHLDSTIRISFSVMNTEEEVDYALQAMKEILPMLRRYRRH